MMSLSDKQCGFVMLCNWSIDWFKLFTVSNDEHNSDILITKVVFRLVIFSVLAISTVSRS